MATRKKKGTRGRPSKFPAECRRDVDSLVLDEDRTIADVDRSVGLSEGTLGNWVRLERIERGGRGGLTGDERGELGELRSEVTQLRLERDLLKRSLAFWVKETSTR